MIKENLKDTGFRWPVNHRTPVRLSSTMYKKHKWLSGLRGFRAFNQLRQICDLTVCFKTLNLCQITNLAQYKLTGKYFEITYVSYTER